MGVPDPVQNMVKSLTSQKFLLFNHIWTGLIANLKSLEGILAPLHPNLAISYQITIKLGKGILWVEIFTN